MGVRLFFVLLFLNASRSGFTGKSSSGGKHQLWERLWIFGAYCSLGGRTSGSNSPRAVGSSPCFSSCGVWVFLFSWKRSEQLRPVCAAGVRSVVSILWSFLRRKHDRKSMIGIEARQSSLQIGLQPRNRTEGRSTECMDCVFRGVNSF